MSNWSGAFHLFRRETTRFRKIMVETGYLSVVSNLLSNNFYICGFGREVNGLSYIQFLAPGLIAMTLINSSFFNFFCFGYFQNFQEQFQIF